MLSSRLQILIKQKRKDKDFGALSPTAVNLANNKLLDTCNPNTKLPGYRLSACIEIDVHAHSYASSSLILATHTTDHLISLLLTQLYGDATNWHSARWQLVIGCRRSCGFTTIWTRWGIWYRRYNFKLADEEVWTSPNVHGAIHQSAPSMTVVPAPSDSQNLMLIPFIWRWWTCDCRYRTTFSVEENAGLGRWRSATFC